VSHSPASRPEVQGAAQPPLPESTPASLAGRRVLGDRQLMLALGALGVVYGDLGTNPLFAMRECFVGPHGLALTPANILGSISLAVWALLLLISLKYALVILRADNEGEGGTLALLAKIPPQIKDGMARRPVALVVVLLFGSALLLGDGIVTPAISVLAAVEGLGVAQDKVITYTVVILGVLFLIQRFGTHRVGAMFGPVMLIWFVVTGVMGAINIFLSPGVLAAFDPRQAIALLRSGQRGSYLVLGAIILVVAGGEALYADLGHFGRKPIVRAWYRVVLPSLLLTYVGQGALLLRAPDAIENPFFRMAPNFLRYPLVALATVATVIASQALISGSFSLARQAVNLGFLPRLTIRHTSTEETGQIYVPIVNTALMFGCLALVLGFGSSSKLAGAYGLAVNGTMTATTIGFFFVMWRVWKVNLFVSALAVGAFLTVDLAFLGANAAKFLDGGWVPLCIGSMVFALAMIWRWGRLTIGKTLASRTSPIEEFLAREGVQQSRRVPGTAVFMTSVKDGVPPIVVHQLERNGVLHEQVVLLSVVTLDIPFVEPKRRMTVSELGGGFTRVVASYGYEETPNVPLLLEACAIHGLVIDFERITYVLVRDTLRLRHEHGPLGIPRRVFRFLSRNQATTVGYFGLPVDRVIEVGMQLEI
jgi:KUP system potassium uptake protein